MADVLTIGSALEDIIFQTSQGRLISPSSSVEPDALQYLGFEFGAKISIDSARFYTGGGACNAAVCLKKFGLSSAVCARVGADNSGKKIQQELQDAGVDISLMQIDDQEHTGASLALIKTPETEHVVFVFRGANEHLLFEKEKAASIHPSWAYITALQGPGWERALGDVVAYCARHDIAVAWNPGVRQLALPKEAFIAFARHMYVLLVNKEEAHQILAHHKEREPQDADCAHIAQKLLSCGSSWVIVTDGTNGACASSATHQFFVPALHVASVDTTGAGDAFGSTLVAALLTNSGNMEEALKYAIVNAAAVTTEIGAQHGLLRREEIEKQLDRVPVEHE